MSLPSAYQAALRLEVELGDPQRDDVPLSFQRALELDAAAAFPHEGTELLNRLGLQRFHVLEKDGGAISSLEQLGTLYRLVARRDLTLGVAYFKSFLGSLAVWVGGQEEQRQRVAKLLLENGRTSLAMTEREHGTDLQAMETTATRDGDGWRLSGEKWLINNATRSDALTVLARTRTDAGPRSCTYFLVDKRRLAADQFEHLPKLSSHGVRGIDLSGVRFKDAALDAGDMVGEEGSGLELSLRLLQINKTLIPHFALGTADTALRLVSRFARERRLYGKSAWDIPDMKDGLAESFAGLLLGDAVCVACSRALPAVPEQMSMIAAATKYFVPTHVERIIRRLSVLLGARYYLAEPPYGTFEKLVRDNALMSLFDGSTVVNLSHIASQLPTWKGLSEEAPSDRLFDVHEDNPPLDVERLVLWAGGKNRFLDVAASGEQRALALSLPDDVRALLLPALRSLRQQVDEHFVCVKERGRSLPARSRPSLELARRHCQLSAAWAAVGLWLDSRGRGDAFFDDGAWLAIALRELSGRDVVLEHALEEPLLVRLQDELSRRMDERIGFGVVPLPLGR